MSMMPAFSPGPCTTSFDRVGSRFKWTRDDLYEQCSLHITLKIPSSVSEGSRPSHFRTFLYSSGVMPCSATTSGGMAAAAAFGIRGSLIFARRCTPTRLFAGWDKPAAALLHLNLSSNAVPVLIHAVQV